MDETLAGALLPLAPTVVLVAMAYSPRSRLVQQTVKRAISIAAIPPLVLLAPWLTSTEPNVHGAAILSLIIDAMLCEASCVILLVIAAVRQLRGAP